MRVFLVQLLKLIEQGARCEAVAEQEKRLRELGVVELRVVAEVVGHVLADRLLLVGDNERHFVGARPDRQHELAVRVVLVRGLDQLHDLRVRHPADVVAVYQQHDVAFLDLWQRPVGWRVRRYPRHEDRQVDVGAAADVEAEAPVLVRLHANRDQILVVQLMRGRLNHLVCLFTGKEISRRKHDTIISLFGYSLLLFPGLPRQRFHLLRSDLVVVRLVRLGDRQDRNLSIPVRSDAAVAVADRVRDPFVQPVLGDRSRFVERLHCLLVRFFGWLRIPATGEVALRRIHLMRRRARHPLQSEKRMILDARLPYRLRVLVGAHFEAQNRVVVLRQLSLQLNEKRAPLERDLQHFRPRELVDDVIVLVHNHPERSHADQDVLPRRVFGFEKVDSVQRELRRVLEVRVLRLGAAQAAMQLVVLGYSVLGFVAQLVARK